MIGAHRSLGGRAGLVGNVQLDARTGAIDWVAALLVLGCALLMQTITNMQMNTWRLGAEWDATPATLAFATVSTGYKAGGFNIGQFVPDMFWEDIYFYTKARAAGFDDYWTKPIDFRAFMASIASRDLASHAGRRYGRAPRIAFGSDAATFLSVRHLPLEKMTLYGYRCPYSTMCQ